MKRKLVVTVDCGSETCEECESCNHQCSPAECLMFTVVAGEDMECQPLEFSNLSGGAWLRCPPCLAAERKAKENAK